MYLFHICGIVFRNFPKKVLENYVFVHPFFAEVQFIKFCAFILLKFS